jgi:hypothetical protein
MVMSTLKLTNVTWTYVTSIERAWNLRVHEGCIEILHDPLEVQRHLLRIGVHWDEWVDLQLQNRD